MIDPALNKKNICVFVFCLQGDGCVGDEFLRQIEPIAAYVPYMTCPGNHEQKSFVVFISLSNLKILINKHLVRSIKIVRSRVNKIKIFFNFLGLL